MDGGVRVKAVPMVARLCLEEEEPCQYDRSKPRTSPFLDRKRRNGSCNRDAGQSQLCSTDQSPGSDIPWKTGQCNRPPPSIETIPRPSNRCARCSRCEMGWTRSSRDGHRNGGMSRSGATADYSLPGTAAAGGVRRHMGHSLTAVLGGKRSPEDHGPMGLTRPPGRKASDRMATCASQLSASRALASPSSMDRLGHTCQALRHNGIAPDGRLPFQTTRASPPAER